MITALHTLIFADDPQATRDFLRDVLGFAGTDTGGGWLIFKTGPSELGVHPAGPAGRDPAGPDGIGAQRFDVSLICDDLDATMAELSAKGARFAGDVQHREWGVTVQLMVPGAGELTLYQPRYDPPATSA